MYEASNGVIYNQDNQGRCRVNNNGWYEYWTIDELEAYLEEERELEPYMNAVAERLMSWLDKKKK